MEELLSRLVLTIVSLVPILIYLYFILRRGRRAAQPGQQGLTPPRGRVTHAQAEGAAEQGRFEEEKPILGRILEGRKQAAGAAPVQQRTAEPWPAERSSLRESLGRRPGGVGREVQPGTWEQWPPSSPLANSSLPESGGPPSRPARTLSKLASLPPLKAAVVWAEILGPPKALKREDPPF